MRVNGLDYIFRKNLQGDITGIYNSSTELIVEYTYSDAWGAGVTVSGSAASTIGMYNSFRYRGYYYDTESGLYYLNSRYYDPVACRFINADSLLNPYSGNQGYNLYSYCGNNPIMFCDPTGNIAFFVITALAGAVIGGIVGGIVAANNGGNVWAGIGIGAGAGALIGTGAGMAAGAALAGSLTASTGAVAAGGSALVGTIGSGGLSSGLSYIANNVSHALNGSSSVAQAGAGKMRYAFEKGKAGELASGLVKNTKHIPSLTGTASYRIPDGLTDAFLAEVKNYSGTLSYTNQLKDFVLYSQSNGLEMHSYTNAHLTGPLQQAVDSGLIQVFPLK